MRRDGTILRNDPADAAAFAAAREVCRLRGGGLFFPSAFLPRGKREAAFAVVAFCHMIREAMETEDESLNGGHGLRHHPLGAGIVRGNGASPQSPAVATAGLSHGSACTTCAPTGSLDARVALLRERLDDLYAGRLELPRPEARSPQQHALHAFARTVSRFDLPRQLFLEFADGCRADRLVSRYATWASLQRHCRQTAGPVALLLGAILGVTHSGAGEHALQLATGFRLTAILLGLKQDWARGKLYLPLEDLARFRYSERDLAAGVVNDALRELVRFQVERARTLFMEGADGLCWLADDRSRLAAAALVAASAGVLDAIERQGHDVLTRRPAATLARKARRLPTVWALSRRRPGERLPQVFHAAR